MCLFTYIYQVPLALLVCEGMEGSWIATQVTYDKHRPWRLVLHVAEDGFQQCDGSPCCLFVVVGSCPSIYVVYKDSDFGSYR